MHHKTVEIIVGLFVLLAVMALSFLAFRVSGLVMDSSDNAYTITAAFDNIGDLKVRAPVSLGGVRVGRVSDIHLDMQTYRAVVSISINQAETKIPVDSSASIFTEGLLGSNYISLTPGVEDTYFKSGDKFESTHSAIILENLIGQFLFNIKKD